MANCRPLSHQDAGRPHTRKQTAARRPCLKVGSVLQGIIRCRTRSRRKRARQVLNLNERAKFAGLNLEHKKMRSLLAASAIG